MKHWLCKIQKTRTEKFQWTDNSINYEFTKWKFYQIEWLWLLGFCYSRQQKYTRLIFPKKLPHKSQRHIKSLWTLNKGLFTLQHFNLTVNILKWKMNRKVNSVRTWSFRKAEFLSKIASFLPLKFEYANYIFPIPSI